MDAKKIANKGFEEESRATTASVGKHGLSNGARRVKTVRNRAAKRRANVLAFRDAEKA